MGGVLVPFFMMWGGLSFIQVMILQSWFVLWITILEIPTGAVADFFGRKTSIFIGALFNIVAAIVYSSYPNFYVFLLGEFLWALSAALISGADEALMYDTLKEIKKEKESKKLLGRFNSFELSGYLVAAPIGSLIGSMFGLEYAIRAIAIPLFIAAMITLTIKEPKYKKEKESLRYLNNLINGVKYFYNHKTLLILAFDAVSVSVLSFFIIWTYQPLLLGLSFPLALLGFVHSSGGLLQVVILNNFSNLEKLFGSKKGVILISALIVGLGFVLLSVSNNIALSIILIVITFGFGLSRGLLFNNYMNKYIESKNRATVLSTISMINSSGRAILYPVIGVLVEYSMNITLLIIGLLIILVSIFSKVEESHLID